MANRIDAVVEKIKNNQERSRLCSEMAVDTADSDEGRKSFAEAAEGIDDAYVDALAAIEAGDYAEALVVLESARALENDGGDDQHASDSIAALQSLLSESTAS